MIAATYRSLLDQIQSKLESLKRPLSSVRLLAVSKAQPAGAIRELVRLGQVDFGENYVQEWKEKKTLLKAAGEKIHWHFIGHLQSNKVKELIGEVALFHSIDRLKLAEKINSEAEKKGLIVQGLLEVNLAGEASKSGASEKELTGLMQSLSALPNLSILGLMTLPPFSEDPEETRPYFRRLSEILFDLNKKSVYRSPLSELSMGMSHDFLVAVEEGATWVRIGTALFGERRSKAV